MKMKNCRIKSSLLLVGAAALVTLSMASAIKQDGQQLTLSSVSSKVLPAQAKARHSRSLGDMFEKMRSKIFGSRKQAAAAASSNSGSAASASNAIANQVQPSSSVNIGQRQPWDLSSFNQQYNPYSALGNTGSSYQWPSAASSSGQYMNQQYNPLGYSLGSGPQSSYAGLSGASSPSASSLLSSIDGQQSAQGALGSSGSISGSSQGVGGQPAGGLLSSASHLIAQYLSPGSSAASSSSIQGAQANQQQQQNLMSPQQQQQQSQYNEFASILDSMVAQTGLSSQRQPNLNQYLSGPSGQPQQANQMQPQQQQQQQQNSLYQQNGASMAQGPNQYSNANQGGLNGSPMMGADQDMSGSSNIQSYMPASAASPASSIGVQQPQQQASASQKSSMVNLAEQLAPGSQFNKLVSFPFSLSSNEDPSKEGRYKLHIPFLNQHVKRSDQQAPVVAAASSSASNNAQQQRIQQQQQQYLNSYLNQQQQYSANQQQMLAQPSQVLPTIVSPQQSLSAQPQQQAAPQSQQQQASAIVPASSVSSSVSQSVSQSSSVSQSAQPSSSSSVVVSSQPNQSNSVSSNMRPTWSVADLQSSASSSSSKLIPMQPASSGSSVDSSISSSSSSEN